MVELANPWYPSRWHAVRTGQALPEAWLSWLVIVLLIAANALYVAAEFSAVAAQRSQVAQLATSGNRLAARLRSTLDSPVQLDRYIAACQIGITLSSLVAGAYGQAAIAPALVAPFEDWFGWTTDSAESAAAIAVLLVLTTLQVVLGELVPKSIALQYPERTALATYLPTRWSGSLFRGFIWLLNGSAFLILRPFGIRPGGHQHVHSPEEISILITESQKGGAMSREMSRRLERGLRLSERTVRDLMVPRDEIHAIEASSSTEEILRRILASPYSRLPVYRGSLDDIIGAVGTKDVVGSFVERGEVPPLAELVRPMPRVADTLRADQFVRFLEEHRSSKAVVIDADGRVQGFASIFDVLGELFGEIGDELKDAEPEAVPPASSPPAETQEQR